MNFHVISSVIIVCAIGSHAGTAANRQLSQETSTESGLDKCTMSAIVCGKGTQELKDLETRVVGGVLMKKKTHQFLVAVHNKNGFSCGGSIVGRHHILTAGHCVDNNTESDMKVYLGLRKRGKLKDASSFPVREIIKHSGYSEVEGQFVVNDIALLRVDRIEFKDNIIQPICIPFNNELGDAKVGAVAGWGVTKYEGRASMLPRTARLRILNSKECMDTVWGEIMPSVPDSEKMVVCAYERKVDACQGDSGGPLFATQHLTGALYQIGIVSFGDECANSDGIPGIYMKLAYFGGWLREHLHGDECSRPY